ncbi:MAG TPA: peptidoglycan editing factor PgeF, partial [Hyphomicrobiales bacterium]|nr:peptidoglycan editing factor PgeF [Hyphomicrobiales bacterium]
APYAGLNLALHVGDTADVVARNRGDLLAALHTQSRQDNLQLQWLEQVHGTEVYVPDTTQAVPAPRADALYCTRPNLVCGVLTADCLPVLFAAANGREIAVAHAGWRGLLAGVLERTAAHFSDPAAVGAWLGPAIGPCHFEVGGEVRQAFLDAMWPEESSATAAAFAPAAQPGKWWADLYALARLRLVRAGVTQVYGEPRCTCCETQYWYSYRSEGRTGRFASLIMMTLSPEEAL